MATIVVIVRTDHEDNREAAKSVTAALKRGGYWIANVTSSDGTPASDRNVVDNLVDMMDHVDPVYIEAVEPEVWEQLALPVGLQ